MYLLIVLVIGIIIGYKYSNFKIKKNSIGALKIDISDDEPYLFLELTTDINNVYNKSVVTMTVDTRK